MRLALYQPEIAGNVGAVIRLTSCFAVPLDIIMPCGFAFTDKHLKHAAMDYAVDADITRHANFAAFSAMVHETQARIILMTSSGDKRLPDVIFQPDDILLFGNEGHGAPPEVHQAAAVRVRIPMRAGVRSLNLAVSAGIALSEGLKQTEQYPA